jgi:hypothetical protein
MSAGDLKPSALRERERILGILSVWDLAHGTVAYRKRGSQEGTLSANLVALIGELQRDVAEGVSVEVVRERMAKRLR